MTALTVAYITARIDPRFGWFSRSLGRELRDVGHAHDALQVLVIDARLWRDGEARRAELADAIGGRFAFEHHAPKPNVFQGISRSCGTVEDGPAHWTEAVKLADRQEHVRRIDMWWRLTHPEARDYRRAELGWAGIEGERASHAIAARLARDRTRTWTVGNAFNLRELRDHVLAGGAFPIPTEPDRLWVDGRPLAALTA